MASPSSTQAIVELVRRLRAITVQTDDSAEITARAQSLVRDVALARTWLEARHYVCDVDQGFGAHLLHEEPNHTLAVIVGSWLPGRGAPPHDHGTWAVIAGVEGEETNTLWTRLDEGRQPGHAVLRRASERIVRAGDVLVLPPGAIHSVVNHTSQVTLSLHVYGRHVNYTQRSQFDPEQQTERAFTLTID